MDYFWTLNQLFTTISIKIKMRWNISWPIKILYCHCYFCCPSHCKIAISSPPYNTFGLYHCSTLSSLQSLFSPFSSRSYFNMKWTRLKSTINDNLEMLWSLASNSFFFPTIKTFALLSFTTKYQTVPIFLCILNQSWLWLWILSVTLIASFLRK